MSDRNGLFTGSFDPITIGHVQLIERASRLFDRVYVGIFYNPEKVGLFSIEQRVRMVKGALAHLENVEIVTRVGCDSGTQSWGHHLDPGLAQCTGSGIRSQYGLF